MHWNFIQFFPSPRHRNTSESVKKLEINQKRPNPTRVGRLENFRAKPYEEELSCNFARVTQAYYLIRLP
jgi:hypothetical protein